jgi:hypothetical protein
MITEVMERGWQGREITILFLEIDVILFSRQLLHLPIMWSQEYLLMKVILRV